MMNAATTYPALAFFASLAISAAALLLSLAHVRQSPRPKLALARLDMLSYLGGASSVLALVPEGVKMAAPQLMSADPLLWSAVSKLDAFAFVLVPCSIGMGVARRWAIMNMESAHG
jgi:hypothetical protein